ncbi:MAG: PAS domain S-box protein [Desulfobacterales bacterium]
MGTQLSREELHQRIACLKQENQALKEKAEQQAQLLAGARENMAVSNARYRTVFEYAADALFIENDADEILDVNHKACELLGYSRDELLSMKVPHLQAPECRGELGSVVLNEVSTHGGEPFEAVDQHKDGTRIPVEVNHARFAETGLHLSIVRDIRERKRVEQARREAFEIMEKSPLAGFLWDSQPDWRVEFVTGNVRRIFGYSAKEFLNGRVVYRDLVHPDDLERVIQEVTDYSTEARRMEFTHEPYRIVAKGGAVRWVNDHTFIRRDSEGTITHYQGIVEEITDRIMAEQALRESEEKFSKAFELNPDIVAILRIKDGVILNVNDSFENITGYSRQEAIGRGSVKDLNLWADPEVREAYMEEILRTGSTHNMTLRLRTKSGEPRLAAVGATLIELSGEPCVLETIRDVTDERRAHSQLAAEKERLAVTLRSIGDAVITTDREGRIVLMNPIAEDLTGWKEAKALGRPLPEVFRIISETTRQPRTNPVATVLETGRITALANHTVLIAKDGREFLIADSGAPILDHAGEIIGVVLVFRDTTDRQLMEKELLKMEKLKSLGVLAGGIAHDFNNFLSGIIGNVSLAKLLIQSGSPGARELDEMEKAAVRAKDLTQQLLTFSKGGDPVKCTTRIAELVRESTRFALRGSNVGCDYQINSDLRLAEVDEGQIAQVLHNLMINADQAMPDGGVVSIKGRNVTLSAGNPYLLEAGDYIQISVQDQGLGIKAEHLKKVFDPYFTTKQKGSGLGLAVAYNIIAKHNGKLTVTSQLGEGATFTILLPACEGTRIGDRRDSREILTGEGRILIMDDEDFIRNLAEAMLKRMGYQVALAPDGEAAVAMYREAHEAGKTFDAVVLDLTVPGGMGGKEAIGHLRALDPEVRAIVSSGYSNDPVMANYAEYGFCGAVKKPYLIQEMSRAINAAITTQ